MVAHGFKNKTMGSLIMGACHQSSLCYILFIHNFRMAAMAIVSKTLLLFVFLVCVLLRSCLCLCFVLVLGHVSCVFQTLCQKKFVWVLFQVKKKLQKFWKKKKKRKKRCLIFEYEIEAVRGVLFFVWQICYSNLFYSICYLIYYLICYLPFLFNLLSKSDLLSQSNQIKICYPNQICYS